MLKLVFRRLDAGPGVLRLIAERSPIGRPVPSCICRGLAEPGRLDLPRVRVCSCDDKAEPHQSGSRSAAGALLRARYLPDVQPGAYLAVRRLRLLAIVLFYFCCATSMPSVPPSAKSLDFGSSGSTTVASCFGPTQLLPDRWPQLIAVYEHALASAGRPSGRVRGYDRCTIERG